MVAARPGRSIFSQEEDSRHLWEMAVLSLDWPHKCRCGAEHKVMQGDAHG